jgi:hypothetical protein
MNKLLRIVCVLMFSAVCSLCHADNSVVFQLVTDVSQLKAGDQILVFSPSGPDVMEKPVFKSATLTTVACSQIGVAANNLIGDYLTYLTSDMALMELETSSGGWCLKLDETNYLSIKSSGYFCKTTKSSQAQVNISISATNNEATIKFDAGSDGNNIIFYNKGDFRCVSISTGIPMPVKIYKMVGFVVFDTPANKTFNGTNIKNHANQTCTVKMDRTLAADGGWYTLCLPFALTVDDITNQFKGADFEEFTSVSQDGGSVNLKFDKVTETKAGVPYLVKPITTVDNPVFIGKTISVSEPGKVTQNINGKNYSFVGTFDPTTLPVDGTARFIGSNGGELVAPTPLTPTSKGGALNGLRAYFLFPSSGAQAKVCHGEIPTSIHFEKVDGQDAVHRIYNLNGQYVGNDQNRLQKGIYVVNGKKVVIK